MSLAASLLQDKDRVEETKDLIVRHPLIIQLPTCVDKMLAVYYIADVSAWPAGDQQIVAWEL